jgi:hypothetical protein
MLILRGVTKWFGKFRALHAVDLTVAPASEPRSADHGRRDRLEFEPDARIRQRAPRSRQQEKPRESGEAGEVVGLVGVDVAGKEEIRQIVRSLAAEGTAAPLSTDEHLTDRIVVMVRGELRSEFHTRTMRHADLLSSLTGLGGP